MQHGEHCRDVAVGQRAHHLEGLSQRRADTGMALEYLAERFDLSRRPVRDIGERAVLDLAVFAEGLPQEDGGR